MLFFGTQDWAAEVLRQMAEDSFFEITHVITQPDQPTGRKQLLTPSPVKQIALAAGLSVLQPTDLKDPSFLRQIKESDAELAIIIAYGRILPEELISITPRGFINVHPSLLPKWRGPSPIQAAIAAGDEKTGISIMLIDTKMDHGPLLAQMEFPLSEDATFINTMKFVEQTAPSFLIKTVKEFVENKLAPQTQNHAEATYCKLLKREDGRIDWNRSAIEIERMVRAYEPWPSAWTTATHEDRTMRFKLLEVKAHPDRDSLPPGTLLRSDDTLFVGTGAGLLQVLSIQPEGKKVLSAQDFLCGYEMLLGKRFDG